MRAIVQSKYGPPAEVLQLAEVERPAIKDDEVLVRVAATGLHADLWHAVTGRPQSWRFMLGWRKPKRPIPGTDIAGVVEQVGARVTKFKTGDEVFGSTLRGFALSNAGGFAEYAAAPEASLALKPSNVTFEQAASLASSGFIAYSNLLRLMGDLTGKCVLINGAGGGVGTIALQMLKARGAHVTVVDAGPKLEMLRGLGADSTIDYTEGSFLNRGLKYDVIFDIASNFKLEQCRGALSSKGLFIWIGHEHYGRAKGGKFWGSGFPEMFRLMRKNMFGDPNLPKLSFAIPKPGEAIEDMRRLMAEGKLTPHVETYPLASVAEAFRALESAKVLGKIVLVP